MSASFDEVEVFADRLQAAGDPRGRLLALELAGERATSSAEARRLNVETQRVREHHSALAWPASLRGKEIRVRAGFPISGSIDFDDPKLDVGLLTSMRYSSILWSFESGVAALTRARRLGLRLEQLIELSDADTISLAGFSAFADAGEGVALEQLELLHSAVGIETLVRVEGLHTLEFGEAITEPQLCSLAPLALQQLGLTNETLPRVIAPLFGNTLNSLRLTGLRTGDLQSLSGLPWLRELDLDWRANPDSFAGIEDLFRLEALHIHELDAPLLQRLVRLPLRSLTVSQISVDLGALVDGLPKLERLVISSSPSPLDVSPLTGLSSLRELGLPREGFGCLELPPSLEILRLFDTSRLELRGRVAMLRLVQYGGADLPASLLEQLERLELFWVERSDDSLLEGLARRCPRLERLAIETTVEEWAWPDALTELRALTRLRSFVMTDSTVAELDELSRALPEICPVRNARAESNPHDWPRNGV